jgi:hypothetical protein
MAIVAGSLQNVHQSIDRYLQDNLLFRDGTAIPLRLHGQRRFVVLPELPWVEVHYDFIALQNTFMNRLTRTASLVNPAQSIC